MPEGLSMKLKEPSARGGRMVMAEDWSVPLKNLTPSSSANNTRQIDRESKLCHECSPRGEFL